MPKSTEDCVREYIEAQAGRVLANLAEPTLQAELLVAGKMRICTFSCRKNPLKIAVIVGRAQADVEVFLDELIRIDPQGDFSYRVGNDSEYIYWVFDLLVPDGSLTKLLGLWHSLAEIEVAKLDSISLLDDQEGSRISGYEFPVVSTLRH